MWNRNSQNQIVTTAWRTLFQSYVFAVGVFPEDFFVIVAVVVGDDFGGCGGRRGGSGRFGRFSGGFIRGLRWFGRGLFASCHRYHYNIKAKKREPWGEALLGEKGLLEESSLLAIFVGFGERCRELIDAADEITCRLYNVIDWMFDHPEYNPKTKVIPKKDYPVLVDVTF